MERAGQTRAYTLWIASFCAIGLSLAYVLLRKRSSGVSYFTIKLLTRESVLLVTKEVRELYSEMYLRLRHQSRVQRRKHDRNSIEYRQAIEELSSSTKKILEKASQSVFAKYSLTEALFDDSIAYFEDDPDVSQNAESMCEVLNSTLCPDSLTPAKLREVFQYYLDRLKVLEEADLMVKAAVISDEIWETYGFESEQIDVAYQKYKEDVEDLALMIKEETSEALDSEDNS